MNARKDNFPDQTLPDPQTSPSPRLEAILARFDRPMDLAQASALSMEDKKTALALWEETARRLSVATEEGMTGGEPSMMAEVAEAQAALGIGDVHPPGPTKVG